MEKKKKKKKYSNKTSYHQIYIKKIFSKFLWSNSNINSLGKKVGVIFSLYDFTMRDTLSPNHAGKMHACLHFSYKFFNHNIETICDCLPAHSLL